MAKGLGTSYVPGRTRWLKIKHVDTVDAEIVAIVGAPGRPTHLVVRLPDGTLAPTAQLEAVQRAAVGRELAGRIGESVTGGGHRLTSPLVAEVEIGTTRHRTLRFVRLRLDLGT
ncbi:hypothetical protein [Streptomyces sp. NPDC051572]|uniref:hypothetical protein n=1 Tax=Streptomyces sp. NPDC051572 TaxID=3155802 RepID=UPI00344C2EF4